MKNRYILLLAGMLLISAGCDGSKPEPDHPNFLLLSIDTVRADHLGCYGNERWSTSPSPNIDRLAAQGVLFENYYAPRGQTHPSLASMLTGKYPITHTLRENGFILPTRHLTLIQMLKKQGYRTAAFASNLPDRDNPENPQSHPAWWTRGCDSFDDGYGDNFEAETKLAAIEDQYRWDQRIEDHLMNWIKEFKTEVGSPFFLWAHFYDPHKPYIPPESSPDLYPDYKGPLEKLISENEGKPVDNVTALINNATRQSRPLTDEDRKKVMALYDASVYGVDARFDRILSALHEKGMLKNTWIIITSDHGEELGDHQNYYFHGASIYDAVLKIPLIIVGPEAKAGKRITNLVQNVDLAPSLLYLAGYNPLPGMEGYSFADLLRGKADRTERNFVVAEWQDLIYSWSDGEYKYILNPLGACPVKPPFARVNSAFEYDTEELYNIKKDPGEQVNILTGNEGVAQSLRKELEQWIRQDQHQKSMQTSISAEGSMEAMQALGYTGATKDRHDVRFKPKDNK
ncbi:MAG: sulfatase [Planctomycetota bacterium]